MAGGSLAGLGCVRCTGRVNHTPVNQSVLRKLSVLRKPRVVAGALAGLCVLAMTGCGGSDDTTTTTLPTPATGSSASPGPSASASPTSTAAPVVEFSVDGAGPYELDMMLDALKTTPGLDDVQTGGTTCPQNTSAHGVDKWREIEFWF